MDFDYSSKWRIVRYRRGLLCQAKLKQRSTGKWGKLKPNQEKVLAGHLNYLSLLLYEYADSKRLNLMPFRWQLCRDFGISDIKQWLKADSFPSLLDSSKIIELLGKNQIGTDDETTCEGVICPPTKRTTRWMEIIIWWPGRSPEFEVRTSTKEKQHLYEYVAE